MDFRGNIFDIYNERKTFIKGYTRSGFKKTISCIRKEYQTSDDRRRTLAI